MTAKSIRKVSSKPKTPALHSILLTKNRKNADIYEYFAVKREQGSSAVPQPILSEAVVTELQRVVKDKTQRKVGVQIVIVCLDEFSSNNQVQEPWSVFSKEISHLLYECLSFITDAKQYDAQHKTSTFLEVLKILSKLCNLLICLSGKNATLRAAIFNECAEILLSLILCREVKLSLQELILTALCSLCQETDNQNISSTLKRVATPVKYVARMILDMSVDAQMSIYTILYKSVSSIEEATERARVWFIKLPALKDAFIECFPKSFSQGCGLFLDKLYEIRTNSHVRDMKPKITPKITPAHVKSSSSNCPSQNLASKSASSAISLSAGGSIIKGADVVSPGMNSNIRLETRPQFLKPNVDWRNTEGLSSKQNHLKVRLQTPYHPRQTLSLHQPNRADATQSSHLDPRQVKPTQRIQQATSQKGSSEAVYSSSSSRLKSQLCAKTENEIFNISPRNKQFCPRRENDVTASVQNSLEITQKNLLTAQSSLSVLEEEDHCSKVERWFSRLSSDTSNHDRKSTRLDSNLHDEMRETGHKRSAPKLPDQSKKMRMDIPPTPICKWQPNKHAQVAGVTGAIQYELPSVKLKKNISAKDEASSSAQTNIIPVGQKAGKRTLYSKSRARDKEYLGDSFFLEERESPDPLQEPISKTNSHPPKHWEQKVKQLDNNSQVQKSLVYNFGKTESSEKSFKLPSKAPPKKKTAKTPKLPARLACQQNKSSSKNKENEPPKPKRNQGPKKVNDHLGLQPMEEATNPKTVLKDISNRFANNQENNSTTPSISSSIKNTNTKNYSTVFSTSEEDSKMMKETIPQCYSPIQDDSMEEVQPETGVREQTIPPCTINNVKNGTKMLSPPVQQLSSYQNPPPQPQKQTAIRSEPIGVMQMATATAGFKNPSWAPKEVPGLKLDRNRRNTSSTSEKTSRDRDSGIDTSDVHSSSSKEGLKSTTRNESASSQYLRMRLKEYLQQAKNANSEMSSNQNVVSTELVEIKSLVEKLSMSVGRCSAATNSNETNLRQQATALEGCSQYLGPYGNQTCPSKIGATMYLDYKDFVRKIRAQSAEKIREALQAVVDEDLPLSPPDSDVE